MQQPNFLDQVSGELGDRYAFCSRDTSASRQFQPAHVEQQWTRDRSVDVKHTKLDVRLDFSKRSISGTVTHRIAAITGALKELAFDAGEMSIQTVLADGKPAAFDLTDSKLTIALPRRLKVDQEIEVAIRYSARPRRGLYFVGPDEGYPNKRVEAWTQGEDLDSRYWFPCYDYPNDRITSEMIATVPANFFALSNGALIGIREDKRRATKTWHWRHDVPHSNYLITLAAGEFVEVADHHGGLPVTYYVAPGREDDAKRAFGNTPKMIAFFERKIGVPYPYAKYAQIAVSDFIFGGMENSSATTQTADTLHDARAHLDFTSDPLVAHELAHQWWGDLLTCRDWSHAWLNEGFATYFEALWCEENLGADEFAWNLRQDRENYFDEDHNRYRRPIVCNRYRAPIELFDRHLYEKGSLVLHMLRREVGDALFFKSLNLYCTRNRGHNVITQDLQNAFEEATGRNLDWLFDQWVYREGHPEIEVTSAYDPKRKLASVSVKQTHQTSDKTPLFRFSVTIALMDEDGGETRHRVEIKAKEHNFTFPASDPPKAVRFDPEFDIAKVLKHRRGREALELELKHAPEAIGRAAAARELGAEGSFQAITALREALLRDPFWGVRAEAAAALGTIRTQDALDGLVSGLSTAHPKARRAVVRALGNFRERAEAASALIALLEKGDKSYFVEAEAALALAKTRETRAFDTLTGLLDRDSHLDVIRAHALTGLAELRDERGIDIAVAYTTYGRPPRARVAAIGALARLGEIKESRRAEVFDHLVAFESDHEFMVRMRLPGAFEDLRESKAISVLRRMADRAVDGRVRRRAEQAIEALHQGKSRSDESRLMREDLDKLRDENKKLQERLDKLDTGSPGKPPGKTRRR
jgi:aminopeptidase N